VSVFEQLRMFEPPAAREGEHDGGTRMVGIDVRGMPRPQGSVMTHALPTGGVATRYASTVWQWRHQVTTAVRALHEQPFTGAVALRLLFDLPRPIGHMSTAKGHTDETRRSAPLYPIVAPDLDKLVRAICDAITDAGLWHDDAQVVGIAAEKRYWLGPPGVRIAVMSVEPAP
jgi:crossover junction endodeoxyribonuclease RusA